MDTAFFKSSVFIGCFAVSALLQLALPYRPIAARELFKNWSLNLLLGLTGTILVGALIGRFSGVVTEFGANWGYGLLNWLGASWAVKIALSVVILDGLAYFLHRAYHRFSWLWRLHAVHHTDTIFDASTAVRFHPGEVFLSLGIRFGVIVLLGIPVAGLMVFEATYLVCNFIEHSNTALPPRLERVLGWVFITPTVHRKHHSVAEHDLNSNFGTIFSFWDRLFRSRHPADATEPIIVGVPEFGGNLTFLALLALPFKSWRGAQP
jgi:sterol desaturase/sphingolipid hydroxylase (fatty acid hydroxylase superfamily)